MIPIGMPTNGIGKPCDWLNRTVSMADDPAYRKRAPRPSHPPAEHRPITLHGKPVSPREAEAMWSTK